MVFCINSGVSGTFSNLLIPLQIGARDMASGFMNMLYWLFFLSSLIMISSLFAESVLRIQGGQFTLL
jgi:cytochrome c oxidase subunit 1